MRAPAETRAAYPVSPAPTYSMFFCDGVKVCDDLERATVVADSNDDALAQAVEIMRGRPAHEVGVLDRRIADIGASGTRVETEDAVEASMSLHRELHSCGRSVA